MMKRHMIMRAQMSEWVRWLNYLTTHASLSPIRRGFTPCFVNYKKGCTRLAAASDKVYQLLSHGRWFSPGTPTSSTTKTDRHDIAEILLKVALNTKKSNQIKSIIWLCYFFSCHDFEYYDSMYAITVKGDTKTFEVTGPTLI
jgi:hypothetical protein